MLPVLAGYISYSVAGKPGLVAGMIGGWLSGHLRVPWEADAKEVSAGFLGALVAGLIAGYLVQAMKKIPTHKFVKPIMPILIIPVVSSVIIGALMLLVIGPPIAGALNELNTWLLGMKTGNQVVLAMILGAMIAFDMGGPVNKAAFFFASGLIAQGNYSIMGPVAAAICTPPLGLGLATILGRKLWSTEQQEAGYAALGMGTIGITEGAIPFAAGDPFRVIPSIMVGAMTSSTIAMLGGCGDRAPHGGLIVLPVVDNRVMYVVAIVAGTVVTALVVNTLKTVWKAPGEAAG
jgi:fructose-specific phosphotransferase system IIC component